MNFVRAGVEKNIKSAVEQKNKQLLKIHIGVREDVTGRFEVRYRKV